MHRIRSDAHVSRLSSFKGQETILPLSNVSSRDAGAASQPSQGNPRPERTNTAATAVDETIRTQPPPAPPPVSKEEAEAPSTIADDKKPGIFARAYETTKDILFSSIFNVLLIFVPAGIAVYAAGVSPIAVFAINAVAIIPLAGMLAHATEAVAASLGDAMGALLNVTFGNAVELIIFIIALVKNEIRIVQASLVGSILANLLLILGMSFLFGGLRFREQLYNSTVTQMSACLLSLSVTSLVLPTAFHASFENVDTANERVLQLSRGSSIILLLVYVLYLLFQLKSHAYMYESTPQHIIDEESHPGVLANMLNSSSSEDDVSTSSDTDSTSGSHTTTKVFKRAFRRRRKSSASSNQAPSLPSNHSPSASAYTDAVPLGSPTEEKQLHAIASGDEADTDGDAPAQGSSSKGSGIQFRDFENEKNGSPPGSKSPEKRSKRRHRKHHRHSRSEKNAAAETDAPQALDSKVRAATEPQRSTATQAEPTTEQSAAEIGAPRRPFAGRTLSVLPTMPKILASTVFSAQNSTGMPQQPPTSVPRVQYGIRRTSSLPDRLNRSHTAPAPQQQTRVPTTAAGAAAVQIVAPEPEGKEAKKKLSRPSAIILLLVSTALVAVCAEFLVGSIDYMVDNTALSQAFIGLIILPIVGNAAEHVTAVTVASKNKMDLAIGVAVGSSIQIALFVTPVVVLLGWMMSREMSLYFSLFETVSLFVSAFIINFLILDGRSNYLEGALLVAAYVIIGVAAYFYPNSADQSEIGGSTTDAVQIAARGLGHLAGV